MEAPSSQGIATWQTSWQPSQPEVTGVSETRMKVAPKLGAERETHGHSSRSRNAAAEEQNAASKSSSSIDRASSSEASADQRVSQPNELIHGSGPQKESYAVFRRKLAAGSACANGTSGKGTNCTTKATANSTTKPSINGQEVPYNGNGIVPWVPKRPRTLGAASFATLDCHGCLSSFDDAYYCSTTD